MKDNVQYLHTHLFTSIASQLMKATLRLISDQSKEQTDACLPHIGIHT